MTIADLETFLLIQLISRHVAVQYLRYDAPFMEDDISLLYLPDDRSTKWSSASFEIHAKTAWKPSPIAIKFWQTVVHNFHAEVLVTT